MKFDFFQELRCPECRVLVTVPFESLPPNILLMRILEGIKKIPPDSEASLGIKHPTCDPFSFLSQVTAITTTTQATEAGSGSPFYTASSQSTLPSPNNPFLTSPLATPLRGFTTSSAPQNGTIPSFYTLSSQHSNIASTSLTSVHSTSNTLSHSDSFSSLTTTPSTFFHATSPAFSTQPSSSAISPSTTTSVQLFHTHADETSSLTHTSMPVLNTLLSSFSALHTERPLSTSMGSLAEPRPITLVTTSIGQSEVEQPPTSAIRPSVARQISLKSQKESHVSELSPHTYVSWVILEKIQALCLKGLNLFDEEELALNQVRSEWVPHLT